VIAHQHHFVDAASHDGLRFSRSQTKSTAESKNAPWLPIAQPCRLDPAELCSYYVLTNQVRLQG
jgi:hypothetical protein